MIGSDSGGGGVVRGVVEGVKGWLRADGEMAWGVLGRLTRHHVIIVAQWRCRGTLTHVTDSQPRTHV